MYLLFISNTMIIDFWNLDREKDYTFSISWGKNTTLPLLFLASWLACKHKSDICICNVPHLKDIIICVEFLAFLWVKITYHLKSKKIYISWKTSQLQNVIPYDIYTKFRYSILSIWLLLHFFDDVFIPDSTGWCSLWERKNDLHYAFFETVWYEIHFWNQGISIKNTKKDRTNKNISFHPHIASTSLTENIIIFLVLSQTPIESIDITNFYAIRPDIAELLLVCEKFGYTFCTTGKHLHSFVYTYKKVQSFIYTLISDFDQALFYICLALILKINITIKNYNNTYGYAEIDFLHRLFPWKIKFWEQDIITLGKWCEYMEISEEISVNEYPHIMSDSQPVLSSLSVLLSSLTISDTRFIGRYGYGEYYKKFHCTIDIWKECITIQVPQDIPKGYEIQETISLYSIRESWLLLLLVAFFRWKIHIENTSILERGYEWIFEKLLLLGAKIE